MTITKPTTGSTGWDVNVNAVIDAINLNATDTSLPAIVNANGNGQNSFTTGTINTWTAMPSFACTGSIVNPHATLHMRCLIILGVWLATSASGVNIRAGINWTGTDAGNPDVGGGPLSPPSFGFIPLTGESAQTISFQSLWTVDMSPAANNSFSVQGQWDSTSGTKSVNYPGVQIVPLRYV
jgi:hypothetical protein